MKTKVHILGAGFAGLTLALKLAEKGHAVTIYEKSNRVGGLLATEKTEFGLVEKAANALIRSHSSVELFHSLRLSEHTPLKTAKNRFVFRNGKPRRWPLGILETLQFLGKVFPRLIFQGKSTFRPQAFETLLTWGNRHLGKAPTKFLLEPAMQGIYANPLEGLSASLVLGSLFQKKPRGPRYGGLLTGSGGMQDVVDRLQQTLRNKGVQIHLNSAVDIQSLTGPVVVATSAKAASEIMMLQDPRVAALLAKVPQSSLLTATLFFSEAQKKYQGFGCLIPRGFGIETLGVLMNSYIFKDRDQTYNETWILGGKGQQALFERPDAEVLGLIAKERYQVLRRRDELLDYRLTRWKDALPYYGLELEKVQEEIRNLPETDVFLHGNYLSGIGLTKILDRSIDLAERISKKYG